MTKLLVRWVGWYCGINLLFFLAIGSRYLISISPLALSNPNLLNQTLAWLFLSLASIGHFALLAYLPCLVLIPLTCIWPKRYAVFSLAILLQTFFLTVIFIDTIIFKQYRFHLNPVILQLLLHPRYDQIFDFSWLEWLQIGGLFVGIILLQSWLACWLWQRLPNWHFKGKYALYTFAGCLLMSYYLFILSGMYPLLSFNQQVFALPYYDAILSKLIPLEDKFGNLEIIGAGNFAQLPQAIRPLQYPLHPLICNNNKKPLNIVIIGIDSWRFDMVDQQVTPNIFQFANKTLQFTQHFSGGNGTEPGLFSLFYSMPGTYWSTMTHLQREPVFFEQLKQKNYLLKVFASATLAVPPYNKNMFSGVPQLSVNTPGNTPFERDKKITVEFQQFIATAHQQPFFSFVFYNAPHSYCENGNPITHFQPSVGVCDRVLLDKTSNPTPYFNRYKNALYYVDQLVAQDLQSLSKQHLLDNTIVIITGDHSNEFNDTKLGFWGHAGNFSRYQIQTPLLIYWPGKQPQVYAYPTSHYDVVPTLLTEVLGCENPAKDYSIGKSLFVSTTMPFLLVSSYIDFGIVEADRITQFYPTGRVNVTDLNNQPLYNTQPRLDIIHQAFNTLQQFYQQDHS